MKYNEILKAKEVLEDFERLKKSVEDYLLLPNMDLEDEEIFRLKVYCDILESLETSFRSIEYLVRAIAQRQPSDSQLLIDGWHSKKEVAEQKITKNLNILGQGTDSIQFELVVKIYNHMLKYKRKLKPNHGHLHNKKSGIYKKIKRIELLYDKIYSAGISMENIFENSKRLGGAGWSKH